MKLDHLWMVLIAAVMATFSKAEEAIEVPPCASKCLDLHSQQSACNRTDFACLCADNVFMTSVETCTMGNCSVLDGLRAKNATTTICKRPIRDRSLVAFTVSACTGGVALFFVILRVGGNFYLERLTWADACVVLAMALAIAMDTFKYFMMAHGFGKDVWTLPRQEINNVVMYTWLAQISYIPIVGLTKIAILVWYRQTFSPVSSMRITSLLTMVVVAAFTTSALLATIFECNPVPYAWKSWDGESEGSCVDINAFWWAHSGINIPLDLWIIAIAIPQVWKLHLPIRKKVYFVLMFSVGLLITVFSIIRLQVLVSYSQSHNPTYSNVGTAVWSHLECQISVICCCMPYVPGILRRTFHPFFARFAQLRFVSGPSDDKPHPLRTVGQESERKPQRQRVGSVTEILQSTSGTDDRYDEVTMNTREESGIVEEGSMDGGNAVGDHESVCAILAPASAGHAEQGGATSPETRHAR